MKPFEDYPKGGYTILPRLKGCNARREYGHWLVENGQTSCAYCGMGLIDSYEHWLLLTVDHVIPVSNKDRRDGHRLGIPKSWHESYSNIVLALQLLPGGTRPTYAGVQVEVQEDLEGRLLVQCQGQAIPTQEAPPRPGPPEGNRRRPPGRLRTKPWHQRRGRPMGRLLG